ncbi:hypothetical protein [Actinomycetospora termitidis]|uniref:Integral membrane protein n=1 Tax=Actinomycetospora termitidis TaxID=3053470 RepID=A0ABT7MB76_9PSEU|nr:hypothetical protein [Actinomycetospora sp. Odt1-22]MDL5157914.1 hypothetical protein [Actinomycetospora sp. Odt1-22]
MTVSFDVRIDDGRITAVWMLGSFLLVFLVTRVITRLIRAGRGPFRDTSVGGVHVHHLVYGIALMLLAGAGEFIYRPDGAWRTVLAVAFGAGAALALDEFALWLRLADVYWSDEGRISVDAVLMVAVVGTLLVLGANPFGTTGEDGALGVAISIVVTTGAAVTAAFKGKFVTAVVGILLPPIALLGALRLARPGSPWARRRYTPGSRRDLRARARYPDGARNPWDRVVDLVGGVARKP